MPKPSSYILTPSPETADTDVPLCPLCKCELPAAILDKVERCCGAEIFVQVIEGRYTTNVIKF
jgi:hypothetical protein